MFPYQAHHKCPLQFQLHQRTFQHNKKIKLQIRHLPVTIEFSEFFPITGIRFVAQHQMIHIFDVYVIRIEHSMQFSAQISQTIHSRCIFQRFFDAHKGFCQLTQILFVRTDIVIVHFY